MSTLADYLRTLYTPDADGLARILTALTEASKTIAAELARAALVGQLGTTGR